MQNVTKSPLAANTPNGDQPWDLQVHNEEKTWPIPHLPLEA